MNQLSQGSVIIPGAICTVNWSRLNFSGYFIVTSLLLYNLIDSSFKTGLFSECIKEGA
jgi:hypothetical protein